MGDCHVIPEFWKVVAAGSGAKTPRRGVLGEGAKERVVRTPL